MNRQEKTKPFDDRGFGGFGIGLPEFLHFFFPIQLLGSPLTSLSQHQLNAA